VCLARCGCWGKELAPWTVTFVVYLGEAYKTCGALMSRPSLSLLGQVSLVVYDTTGLGNVIVDTGFQVVSTDTWSIFFPWALYTTSVTDSVIPEGSTIVGSARVTNNAGGQSVFNTTITYDVSVPECTPLQLER
jgi:hypothetical protein